MNDLNYTVEYSLELTGLGDFVQQLQQREYQSNLIEAVKEAGDYLTKTWIRNAGDILRYTQGGYVNGIVDGIEYPYNNDPLNYYVVNKSKHAAALEWGNEQWDMKKFLQTSDKVRMNAKGEKYLIIPFRHGIPGTKSFKAMPDEVYKHAKSMSASLITGHYNEGSIKGAKTPKDANLLREFNDTQVKRNIYKWGDKISMDDKTSIYQGMYRFEHNKNLTSVDTGKFVYKNSAEGNNAQNSTYLTFRVMKEGQDGWIYPQREGRYILANTIKEVQPGILQMLQIAGERDIKNLLDSL